MKKITTLLVILLPLLAIAQKSVDLDRFRFSVQFRSLPAIKLDPAYRTYNVEVTTTRLMQPILADMDPANTVRVEGWKKLNGQGHISVNVKLGDLVPGSASVKERVQTTRNGNGILTGTKTFYYQEVQYTFEAEAVISDYKGAHIMDQQLASRTYQRIYRSPEFAVRALAEAYFLANSLTITKELYRECVDRSMHFLSDKLSENFGYDIVSANDNMWVIGSRKHPEYTAWRQALRQVNDVLFNMSASTPITGAAEELKPAIDYFEKIKRDYASSSRHDRKLRYACYYNLAVLYYYLDDPQSMMREANGLELNDFDPNDAKGFKTTATWLKNLFEQNNINTRHFAVDTENLKGPGETGDVSLKTN